MSSGIVYLIGAGPDDPGLVTVRGLELLNSCHAVVYDNSIPDELVFALPPEIERHYVGKRSSGSALTQMEINKLLVSLAGEGKIVARLKAGSPLVFGRDSEEAKYLHNNNIRFEKIPGVTEGALFGKRVMVLRPSDQAQEMYISLGKLGAEVLPYPTIITENFIDDKGWSAFDNIISENKWLIVTSENGVRYFFKQFFDRMKNLRSLADFKIAAVGYGTARALEKAKIKPDFIPTNATTASLAKEMLEKEDMPGAAVVRVRGNLADDRFERTLMEAGADIFPITVYRTYHPVWPEGFKEKLFERPPDIIVFTSGSTAAGLCEMLNESEVNKLIDGKAIVSIGPSTTKIIESHGIKVTVEASDHSVPGVINQIVEYYNNQRGNK